MMKKLIALMIVLMLAFSALAGCANESDAPVDASVTEAATPESGADGEATPIGEGGVSFAFEVTDNSGDVKKWSVSTDEATVGDALLAVGLIEGDVSDFGLMVTHVNGLRGDFAEDGYWWAFYVDGEMAAVGVDATDIDTGSVYAFVYTPA